MTEKQPYEAPRLFSLELIEVVSDEHGADVAVLRDPQEDAVYYLDLDLEDPRAEI